MLLWVSLLLDCVAYYLSQGMHQLVSVWQKVYIVVVRPHKIVSRQVFPVNVTNVVLLHYFRKIL